MDPLSKLHDIILPAPIGVWPFSYGWYLLILVLLCVLGFAWYINKMRQQRIYHDVVRLLNGSTMPEASVLLRRVALIKYPQREVAGLQGDAWLAFLDETGNTTAFTTGVGRVLISAPYRADSPPVSDELNTLLRQWIDAQGVR